MIEWNNLVTILGKCTLDVGEGGGLGVDKCFCMEITEIDIDVLVFH